MYIFKSSIILRYFSDFLDCFTYLISKLQFFRTLRFKYFKKSIFQDIIYYIANSKCNFLVTLYIFKYCSIVVNIVIFFSD